MHEPGDTAVFRLLERRNGADLESFVAGFGIRLFRVVPGRYEFRVQACARREQGQLVCGKPSKKRVVEVTDAVNEPADGESGLPDPPTAATADSVAGGPDALRPGHWYNPDRSGHGWSFYWSNRLALSETDARYGYSYDLHGIWFTYEAKRRYLTGCDDGAYLWNCSWAYDRYRPLALNLRLVKTGPSTYGGAVFVTRDGAETQQGVAQVTFGPDNVTARVDWTVDFKYQRLAGVDSITLLAGSRPSEWNNATHYSGLWSEPGNPDIQVSADLGSLSEAVELVFPDDSGDPVWIQAANRGSPDDGATPLCFYYVTDGYAPNRSGSISLYSSGCDYALEAGDANRNGGRYFTGFETARFWADFTLPAEVASGSVRVGSPASPVTLKKTASFHRIYYTQPESGCQLTASSPGCAVRLTWFTDGDYPEATAFALNLSSGQRAAVATANMPAVVGQELTLDETGAWVFELRMGRTADSTLIARSGTLLVSAAELDAPTGLRGAWLDQASRSFHILWTHSAAQQVAWYELQESTSGSSLPVVYRVSPGDRQYRSFEYPSGPYGELRYRVRACRQSAGVDQCSAWSPEFSWFVPPPDSPAETGQHPWGDHADGSGALVRNIGWHYAMGYHFSPLKDGFVTELGGLFNGSKTVRLFDRKAGELLATAQVTASNSWAYAAIAPVAVEAGREYTVAVYLAGSGGSYYSMPSLPGDFGDVTILGSTFAATSSDPAAVPVNLTTYAMYGQADIGFQTAAASPNRPPSVSRPPDQQNERGETVTLSVAASDPDGDPVSCSFGGLPAGLSAESDCDVSGTITANAGVYQVTVTASDGQSQSQPVSFLWEITEPPVSTRAKPETPPEPSPRPSFAVDDVSVTVGVTNGEFSVDQQGAANYRIPLLTAPGSGGFVPEIALEYSSSGANDVAGVGWGIAGLSVITRCPQTREHDSAEAGTGVDFSRNDRFCLDGQRLMLLSGEYGADGSEYRTEIDTFARIIAFGSAGAGPAYFRVWHGDGTVSDYGATVDSRVEARGAANGSTVLSWTRSRLIDAHGNFIDYRYLEDETGPVSHAIDRISYTGNMRAGSRPYAELKFVYARGRQDTAVAYLAGVALQPSRLLVRVDSMAKANAGDRTMQPLRSWFLSYGQDGHGRKALESVRECSDASARYCFQPTRFDWHKSEHGIADSGTSVGSLFTERFRDLGIADVNGDGLRDLLVVEQGESGFAFRVAYARSSGSFRPGPALYGIPGVPGGARPVRLHAIDINADGYQDVVYPRETAAGVSWVTRLASAAGFGNETMVASDCCFSMDPAVARVLDFNGDGLADLMTNREFEGISGRGELVVLLNAQGDAGAPGFGEARPITLVYEHGLFAVGPTSNGWYASLASPRILESIARSALSAEPFDFNGDGRVDMLARIEMPYEKCLLFCVPDWGISASDQPAAQLFYLSDQPLQTEQDLVAGSQQGMASFYVVFESDGANRYVQRTVAAIGAGADCNVPDVCDAWRHLPSVAQMSQADINADGLAELVFRDASHDWYFQINTGAGFSPPQLAARPPDADRSALAHFIDLSGDGFPELIYPAQVDVDAATWTVHMNDLGSGFGAGEITRIVHGNQSEGDASILEDFNGDGMVDNLFVDIRNGYVRAWSTRLYQGNNRLNGQAYAAANTVRSIVDGHGARTDLSYRPLTDPLVYRRMHDGAAAAWGRGSPVFDLVAPVYVVSSVSRSAPVYGAPAAVKTTEYHYAGGKIQSGGRGFLGFGEVVSWDWERGIRRNTRYRQDFPFIGLPAEATTAVARASGKFQLLSDPGSTSPPVWPQIDENHRVPGFADRSSLLTHEVRQWEGVESAHGIPAWSRRLARVLRREYGAHGELRRKSLTRNQFISHGRVDQSIHETWGLDAEAAESRVTTDHQYQSPDLSSWRLSRIAKTTVVHERPGRVAVTRTTAFQYDPSTGALTAETTEPGSAADSVSTVYHRDAFGNRVRTTVNGAGLPERVSQTRYDPLGRFTVGQINHYGQFVGSTQSWDAFGNALRMRNIDGVRTEQAADPMGRIFVRWTENGEWTRTLHRRGGGSSCPATTAYHTVTVVGGGPGRLGCHDILGREIRASTEGFDGRWIHVDTGYDASGRPQRVSEPYFAGGQVFWNVTEYDELGRVLTVDAADGNDLMFAYDGDASSTCVAGVSRAVRTTNALGQDHTEHFNALGEKIAAYDSMCGRVSYAYDAIGNLSEVTGADGVRIRMLYDSSGRKVATDDPDKGYWQYAWNALGELTRQLDARGQAIDYRYDELGRVTERLELIGVGHVADRSFTVRHHEKTVWENSTAASATGKAQKRSVVYRQGTFGRIVHGADYAYDAFGRLQSVVSEQEGLKFFQEFTYDAFSRPFQAFDASGDYRGARSVYSSTGYLEAVREAREGVDGVVYKRVLGMDARGRVSRMRLGNGVEVFASHDPASGQLRRLEAYDAHGAELQELDYLFDLAGNLVQRWDGSDGRDLTEQFDYDSLNRLLRVRQTAPAEGMPVPTETLSIAYDRGGNISRKSDVGYYHYGGASAGPHAVSSAGGTAYEYDANGNQTAGGGRSIAYSVFDKATRIERNGASTEFVYGIGHQRISRIDESEAGSSRTTHYVGTVEFILDTAGERFRRHLGGVAIVDHFPASGASAVHYLLKDRLGSIHSITDESGRREAAVWASFNAFGERRSPNWAGALGPTATAQLTSRTVRGFTGHEHVDDMGIIHMNGRIYDPRLGRFLQADPLIQGPGDSQSLNRYSYARNNPLRYTDPSGFFFERLVKRWGRLIAAVAISVLLPGPGGLLATQFGVTNIYLQAAITGFVAGAITSGTFEGAVIGAVVAIAVAGVIQAHTSTRPGANLARGRDLAPGDRVLDHLYGPGGPDDGLYRINVLADGAYESHAAITAAEVTQGDVIFTNGMRNGFGAAVRNGTRHLHQAGLLKQSYVLNFNSTQGFFRDLFEAARDVIGAHTGWTHSSLARDLAAVLDGLAARGIEGIRLVGHSQGGAITASALRYGLNAGLDLSALSGGAVALHGAPVNAWLANNRLAARAGVGITSRAQFGDAVHVLGGLNISNPVELPVALFRIPALFSPDPGLSPHTLPCGGGRRAVCAF